MGGLFLEFANIRGAARRLGPYDRLCFEGETLVAVPRAELARHVNHEWHLTAGGVYTRLECNQAVRVHFSAHQRLQSAAMGPFNDFSCVDGIFYVNRKVFAFIDREHGDWYSHELGTHWKVLVVEPA
jgi:hypothetical protein